VRLIRKLEIGFALIALLTMAGNDLVTELRHWIWQALTGRDSK
jgi:hypothetical protein